MITHERSSSTDLGEPVVERIRMVGSPETFNRLSSLEPPNFEQVIVDGRQPCTDHQFNVQAIPGTDQQQFNVQAIPVASQQQLEAGLTEQIIQAPGGPQIKIRTKTEIEMIQPEEEPPPPPPRRGIEAITRQQIEEFPSPDGGEPLYSTSQENIVRRIDLPGRRVGRRRSGLYYGGGGSATRGLCLSPDARIIRTTSKKVTGPDGQPRMDTKVAISPPRTQEAPAYAILAGRHASSSSSVHREAELLKQLSMMVNERTDRELKRLRSSERRRRRGASREKRRRRRAKRRSRRWESEGGVPFDSLPDPAQQLHMVHSQLFNAAMMTQGQPRGQAAASVANALEQCCNMLENVADEFKGMPHVSPRHSRTRRRGGRRRSSEERRASCVSTICSWLGLSQTSTEQGARRRRRRRRSSTTRHSSSGSSSGSSSWSSSSLATSTWATRPSSRSSRSGRCSKEFEFITHITRVDPNKLRSGKRYRIKGPDDRSSSDTVTTRQSITCYHVMTPQEQRVGDWNLHEPQTPREVLLERGVEGGDHYESYDGRDVKGRRRKERGSHSDETSGIYPARASRSYDRVQHRFSPYAAGYADCIQPLIPNHVSMNQGEASHISATLVIPDGDAEPMITAARVPSTASTSKLQQTVSATQDLGPPYRGGPFNPAMMSLHSTVSRATERTYASRAASYETVTVPATPVLPVVQVARPLVPVLQDHADLPAEGDERFAKEEADAQPSASAGAEWLPNMFGEATEKRLSSHVQECAPVFVAQPQPQFISEMTTAAVTTSAQQQYIVYNNPYNYYASGVYQPSYAMVSNVSPIPTASAPILRQMSRSYREEEYYTDGSTTESDPRGGGSVAQQSYLASNAGSAPWATSTGSTAWAATTASGPWAPTVAVVPTRKPAYMNERVLTPRDPQEKSNKLCLGQTCRTYDRWMAAQARCEANREHRKTGYQVHIIVAFLMLLATIIGALAILSVYGRRRYMAVFVDSDEFNNTMNSPWYKYFLRSFSFKENQSGGTQEAFGLCRTPECRREGAYIASTLNWSINPCSDFYGFACSLPTGRPDFRKADDIIVGDIKNALLRLLRDDRRFVDSPVATARNLWLECMNVTALSSLKTSPLESVLSATGLRGWPYEADGNHTVSNVWNTSAMIIRYFSIPTLLTVHLTKVSRTSDAVVVLDKSNAFGSLLDFKNNFTVTERSRSLLELMRLVNAQAPQGLSDEVLEFIHYVLRLTESSSSKDSGEQVRSLGDLSLFQPFVIGALSGVLDNVTGDPVLLLQSSDYITDLIEAIRLTPPHVSLNYLGYVLLDHLRPFILPSSWNTPNRGHVCLEAVDRALPRMVHYMAYMQFKSTLENVAVRNIIDDLKHELMTAIAKTSWLDVMTKSQMLKRLTEIQVHAFFPHWMSNTQLVRDLFADTPDVQPGLGLHSYQQIRTHAFRASLVDQFDKNDFWKGSVFDTDCSVDTEFNNVYFPVTLLNVTGRTTQFFLLFQIPRIGSRLVRCLLLMLLEGGGGQESASWWSPVARQGYETRRHCFGVQRPDVCDDAAGRSRALLHDVVETATLAPVMRLYKMYITSRSRHRTDYRFQNAEGVSTNQLFYVYHALNLCEPDVAQHPSLAVRPGVCNDMPRRRINGPLMNDREFEKIFGCSSGTNMNPTSKCTFW